ncbi:MAG: hypothetical protein ABI702_04515 [Burkholderiales bacterium]
MTMLMLYGAFNFHYIDDYGYGFFMSVFGYSLIAVAFSTLVLAALSPASALHRLRVPGAAQIALWSYSIYLTHKPLAHIIQGIAERTGAPPWATLPTVLAASVLVGALSYRFVEAPFMRIRQLHFPGNFATPSASPIAAAHGH